jgi:hypothetical protein
MNSPDFDSSLEFFDPQDGGDIFLGNFRWLSKDHMALYTRRWNSSQPPPSFTKYYIIIIIIIIIQLFISSFGLLEFWNAFWKLGSVDIWQPFLDG